MLPYCHIRINGADQECILTKATINHGRDDAVSQPDASTATLNIIGVLPAGTQIGNYLQVYARMGDVGTTEYIRFSGNISDLLIGFEPAENPDNDPIPVATIIAVGPLAQMGRRLIGDTPWPAELDGARAARAITLSGVDTDGVLQDAGTVTVLPRDVDAQPALAIAGDAAEDGAGILYQRKDGLIGYADALRRRNAPIDLELDACHIDVGAVWVKNLEGLVNDVRVRYGLTPDGGEQPELRSTNAQSIAAYGTFGASLTTRLSAQADAQMRADTIIARQSTPTWVFAGFGVPFEALPDDEQPLVEALLNLDMHHLISVTGLPAGAPSTSMLLWVEGWRERIEAGEDGVGSWVIDFAVTDYCMTAAIARWDDVPSATTWDNIGTGYTWDSISCLPPSVDRGRWDDVPASQKWDQQSNTTWDNWT